jgi:hypothetical protein
MDDTRKQPYGAGGYTHRMLDPNQKLDAMQAHAGQPSTREEPLLQIKGHAVQCVPRQYRV